MSDPSPKKRSLSEISHLFLSSIRERQTDGAPKPNRTPPTNVSIDLTPEEFAQVYGGGAAPAEAQRKAVPISAVIAAHLNGKQFDRTREYARSMAARLGRIGLIELDSSELRLMCFEPGEPSIDPENSQAAPQCIEPRQMIEALEEMNWDIEHWLLLLPNPRTPEARAILREIEHWVLLSTCDHDGIVCSYRMLKGLADSHRPLLTLSLLDPSDDEQVTRVFQKLSGVCQQFLEWPLDFEPPVQNEAAVSDHLVLQYRPTHDKAQIATAPQWTVVSEFIASSKIAQAAEAEVQRGVSETATPAQPEAPVKPQQPSPLAEDIIVPENPIPGGASAEPTMHTQPRTLQQAADSFEDVIDLPGHDLSGQAILAAVLRRSSSDLIECPLRPPMCVESRLAVARDRALVLLAVATKGLHELQMIGQAYRWLKENQELIGMALPQFAIDPNQMPRLRLLVDRADLSAEILQPLLQGEHLTVQAYRKLRWGEKLGVFLEAA